MMATTTRTCLVPPRLEQPINPPSQSNSCGVFHSRLHGDGYLVRRSVHPFRCHISHMRLSLTARLLLQFGSDYLSMRASDVAVCPQIFDMLQVCIVQRVTCACGFLHSVSYNWLPCCELLGAMLLSFVDLVPMQIDCIKPLRC
jgi:hypothetical protein